MEKATKIINNSPWPFARLISCHLICSNPESCPTSDSSCHLGQSCSPDELRSKRTASSADKCIRGQEPKAKCEMQALNPFFFFIAPLPLLLLFPAVFGVEDFLIFHFVGQVMCVLFYRSIFIFRRLCVGFLCRLKSAVKQYLYT